MRRVFNAHNGISEIRLTEQLLLFVVKEIILHAPNTPVLVVQLSYLTDVSSAA